MANWETSKARYFRLEARAEEVDIVVEVTPTPHTLHGRRFTFYTKDRFQVGMVDNLGAAENFILGYRAALKVATRQLVPIIR